MDNRKVTSLALALALALAWGGSMLSAQTAARNTSPVSKTASAAVTVGSPSC